MNYSEAYSRLHENEKYFPGYSIDPYVPRIAELIKETQPVRLLDYGCGKGFQYLAHRVHMKWGGLLPHCYDVGVRQLSARPDGLFQGIICTDVMEHIEEEDVDAVLDDIFNFVDVQCHKTFVFFSICCLPARKKKLPDGRDVHLTVRPPAWWNQRLYRYFPRGSVIDVEYEVSRP